MSSQPWTIDAIAHAIPDPGFRQRFFSEINLAPVDQLQTVLDRWIRFVEDWEAGRPAMEALLQYAKEHGGELPPEYQDDGTTDDFLARLEADTATRRQGSNAA